VTDGDDQIGLIDRIVHVISLGERRGAHVKVGAPRHGTLTHLRIEERDAHPSYEIRQGIDEPRPIAGGADHDERPESRADEAGDTREGMRRSYRPIDGMRRHERRIRLLGCNVLRQLEVHRAWALLHGDAKGITHQRRDRRSRDNLPGHLGERPHGADDIDHLKARLARILDGLLAGEHHHGHRAQMRVRRAGREVERAGPESRQAHARTTGEATVGRGHESGRLLVPRDDELDARLAQRLDHIEVLFPGHAEDALDPLVLERRDEQVRSLAHRGASE
jgi:hypothetical protein